MLVLAGCDRLATIPYSPEVTPEKWLNMQPFIEVRIWGIEFILVQPSSTLFVYLLGIVAVGVGIYFWRIRGDHRSRLWWSIAMVLWGSGALFAGTSYQAFSYEIKCAGLEVCSWTSWWEIAYLVFSAASVDALVFAGAYSCCTGKGRSVLSFYAALNFGLYSVAILLGVGLLNEFLLSFELLLLATVPSIIMLFILNTGRFIKYKDRLDLSLMITWLWLGIIFGAYFLYLSLDIGGQLWERGAWFSENDVLHIGLISWMLYIAWFLAPQVADIRYTRIDSS
jgi:hypothetical protein